MRGACLNRLLAGAAVAAALTLAGSNVALAQSNVDFGAAVPVPDTSLLPPPTIADVDPTAASSPAPTAVVAAPQPMVPAAPAAATTGTTTGSIAPPTLASVDAADTAVAEKLRDLGAGKYDRLLGGKRERTGIETFYAGRNNAPLWIASGAMNDRAKAAVAYLAGVDADGLDPSDYPTPNFAAGGDADAQVEAELKFTQAVLAFVRHAQFGRVHYSRIAADIEYDRPKLESEDVLSQLASANNVAAALDGFLPQHPGYKALKAKLGEARRSTGDSKPRLAGGPVLKYSKDKKGKETVMDDPRVPMLRELVGVTGDTAGTSYDKPLADAVAKFQKSHGLPPNGQLTTATVDAINGPRRDRDAEIIVANMERWRWMPRDLGKTYVMVNIPDYSLRVVRDDKLYWQTKIVVGKPSQATPITTASMKFITVNPTWNVPPSIIKNEYLPALAQDPGVLERMGLKLMHNPDGTVRIWQPPGDRNALGRIRFNFPNKFLVYQHDTPDKNLFAHDKRAYSHGCMRVMDPLKYGEVILSLARPGEGYTAEKLRSMFGGSEVNINFPTSIPVHLTYQTAYVDDAGKLVIREDIYGSDSRVMASLKGAERRVADVPMDRPRNTSAVPVRMPPGSVPGGMPARGPSFFDQLFGGFSSAPAAAPPPARSRSAARQ